MAPAALHTHHLAIGYHQQGRPLTVCSNLQLRLPAGRLTCLLGPNGIGKSTLLKTLGGSLPPLQGEIRLGDIPLQDTSIRQRARLLTLVLTDKPALGHMTVYDLVSLGRYPYTNWRNTFTAQDHEAVALALRQTGLEDEAYSPLYRLSDGNLQKAIIGRALAQQTRVILLDEPTIHLDVPNKHMIIRLLQQLCLEQGLSILLSTHDLQLALDFAHHLWLLGPEGMTTGLTEDLVLEGHLERLFGNHRPPAHPLPGLTIRGDAVAASLLRQALAKARVKEDNLPGTIIISSNTEKINIQAGEQHYNSINQLIESLTTRPEQPQS